MTVNVSSSWTLFLKLILPVVWGIFFGCFTLFVLIAQPFNTTGSETAPWVASAFTLSFYLSTMGLIWLRFMRLVRVEMNPEHFFVSDYFKDYRYTYESIRLMEIRQGLWFHPVVIHFHEKSSFGERVVFFRSYKLALFLKEFPEVAGRFEIVEK